MIDHIVVPFDASEVSERALVAAPVFAERAGADIEVLMVGPQTSRIDHEAQLADAAARVGGSWRFIETGGDREAVLLTALRRGTNELWCMGSHGRGAMGEMIAGSVSEQLVRDAHQGVLLVGPHAKEPPLGPVLAIALDGTDESEEVLQDAAGVAAALGMSLRLLQVAGPGSVDLPRDALETAYLHRVAGRAAPFARDEVDYDVLHGHAPAVDLAKYARHHDDIGLIAVGTHGRRGPARLVHPSTSFDLVHHAPVPVLVVHPASWT